jgi:hypothetical protein
VLLVFILYTLTVVEPEYRPDPVVVFKGVSVEDPTSEIGVAVHGGLGALETLGLMNNQLTSVLAALGGLGALETLGLMNNQLTSVPAEWEKGGKLEKIGGYISR